MKLLVIDIQKGITDSRLYNYESFIDNTKRIIDAARVNLIEVIYFQHDDGPGTGFSIGDEDFEIANQVKPIDGEKIFVKKGDYSRVATPTDEQNEWMVSDVVAHYEVTPKENNEYLLDSHGHLIVKHDLFNHDGLTRDGIAEAFAEFAKKEGLSFF